MRFVRRLKAEPTTVDPTEVCDCLRSFPISLAVLFGSHARKTEHTLSDLDIAVLFDGDLSETDKRRLLDTVTAAIIEATGIEAVDLVDLERVAPCLGYEIMTNGNLLLGDRTEAVSLETTFLSKKIDFKPVKAEWQSALNKRLSEGTYGRS